MMPELSTRPVETELNGQPSLTSFTNIVKRTLFSTIGAAICLAFCGDADATSGWDRHQVDIDARYRIHGELASFVHRLDDAGQPIEPPLCSTQEHDGLHGPPRYAVTSTHLVLRYQAPNDPLPDPATALNCFAIRLSDDQVIGPMPLNDLLNTLGIESEALRWKTARTPSAWPLALYIIVGTILRSPLILAAIVAGAIAVYFFIRYVIRRWARRSRSLEHLEPTSSP